MGENVLLWQNTAKEDLGSLKFVRTVMPILELIFSGWTIRRLVTVDTF